MYFDGLNLTNGSSITNLVVDSGSVFPTDRQLGELFYFTGANPGLYNEICKVQNKLQTIKFYAFNSNKE